jgi:8-oxo-dGTP pyrophosphatase MutT (NUDIX family)
VQTYRDYHMKTIFYEQNQLNISIRNQEGYSHIYESPKAIELKFIIDLFLNSKNYKGLITGDSSEILKQIKKHFIHIKASGGLVLNKKNEVLLIKRLGKWDLPKGKLEVGETKPIGAIREVEEECGITGVKIVKKLKTSYHVYPYKNSWALKTSYWYWMTYEGNEKLIPQAEENITEAIWVNFKKLNVDALETYPSIAAVLHQSQSLLE